MTTKPPEAHSDPVAPPRSRRELDRTLVAGLAWTGGMRALTNGIHWIAALLVVRLLTPEDYGVVAMATAYVGLVHTFSEFGLGAAIVQRQSLSSLQIARLSGVSVLSGTALALVSIAAAGLIADFFNEPRVRPIITVLAISFVIAGIDVVPRALLKRDLEFKRSAWIQGAQNLTQAVTSLTFAVLGFGYWSLVLAALAGQLARMTSAVIYRPHRIAWPRELSTIKAELWFGWHVVVSQFALYIRRFSDILIVGRVLGTEALGAYNVAWTQANIPVDRVNPVVNGVSAPVLAAARRDPVELRRYIRIFTEGLAFVSFPATLGMAVVADHFVIVVFGDRWMATIGPLRILALLAALRSITPILSQVLITMDQAKKNMQFAVAAALIIPIFLLIGSQWGIMGVAMGWVVGQPLATGPVLLRHALRAVDMPMREYMEALRAPIAASAVMVIAVIGMRLVLPEEWPLAVRLAIEVATGVAVYGSSVLLGYRSKFQSFVRLLRSPRRKGGAVAGDRLDDGTGSSIDG